MCDGWIKLFRQVTDDDLYFDGKFDKLHAWIDLLLLAGSKNRSFRKRGIKVELEAGELAVSVRDLAARWKWSVNTVQRYLNELELIHKIEIRKSNVINVLRVVNWQKYQQNDTQSDTQIDTQIETEKENFPPYPLYKEKEKEAQEDFSPTLSACAYAHGRGDDALIVELSQSQIWIEQVCMALHVQPQEVITRLSEFAALNTARGASHYTEQDLKSHFVDWLRIQLKQKQNEISRNDSRPTREQRLADYAADIAADFAGCS